MVESDPRRRYLRLLAAGAGTALAGCSSLAAPGGRPGDESPDEPEKIDDWQYDPDEREDGGGGGLFNLTSGGGGASFQSASAASGDGGSVGLSAGGAKRIASFRRNIEGGYLPQPESLAYEGLFYNYYFDTGGDGSCDSLFCPSYSPAVTADPLSGETERYLTVGLNSGLDASQFDRKKLNLVVVLDISGSMSSPFSEYYYDQYGNEQTPEGDTDRPKIEVARDALVALTEQLREGDRLGVVLYDDESAVAKPLRPVEATDMDAIRDHIREDVRADGGTNLDAGLADATELLSEYEDADQSTYENRMVVVTDAMPNLGDTDDESLRDKLADNAERNLHATFVGVGVDFNADLVDELTAIRGANYYAVHSADEFERTLGEEFEYMVTPLAFDVSLQVEAEGYDVKQVYGSTAAEDATDELLGVNTLFASPTKDGKTRGGVVLLQVERQSDDATMRLSASWEDRQGDRSETETTISFPDAEPERFANTGVRKAVLLSRYADLLKNWMVAERAGDDAVTPDADERDGDEGDGEADGETTGIEVPPEEKGLGEWEQQSVPLTVSERYAERIGAFADYFETEAAAIGDDSLDRELATMESILEQG
ncbi:VWA domain-containing protein [Halobacteria archaeon HArc-gm2]|nr:VWA domain-containing protein [Halobacteria archaeon HArc-gm2]